MRRFNRSGVAGRVVAVIVAVIGRRVVRARMRCA